MRSSLKRAEENLAKYKDALEAIVKRLLEVETLEQEEYHAIIKTFGIEEKVAPPKKDAQLKNA